MTATLVFDPKGLIREAFRIEGIAAPECRSIFLDWVLGLPADSDTEAEVRKLIAYHQKSSGDDHPMMLTLQAALTGSATPHRRGGRQARLGQD